MFGLFKSEKEKVKEKLKKFQFPVGFKNRLRREQGWSLEYADKMISEYLKFLFLAKFHPPVTPSRHVDEVWHLHLIYSDSYWNEMCGKILKMKLHHRPSSGKKEEEEKYRSQYESTQNSYQSTFASDSLVWGSLDSSPSSTIESSFGGGHFGGSGAGSDWGDSGHSSGGDSGGHSSCSSSSCSSSSCGSSCGGGD